MSKECVIITGGTRGIGLASALRYSSDDTKIILTYKDNYKFAKIAKSEMLKVHEDFHIIKCDTNKKKELDELASFLKRGRLKVKSLINNQGSTRYETTKLKNIDIDLFREMLETNLVSHLKIINLVLPFMKKGGSIINVSSIASINGKGSNMGYCASKSALDSVTRSLAHSLSPKIRVNSICPGLTKTDMTKKAPVSYIKNQIDITPLQRLATSNDIANTIYSIAEQNTFINGQSIVVDGGRLLN